MTVARQTKVAVCGKLVFFLHVLFYCSSLKLVIALKALGTGRWTVYLCACEVLSSCELCFAIHISSSVFCYFYCLYINALSLFW